MAKAKVFKTKGGKATDIFHSMEHLSASAKTRRDRAFSSPYLEKLTARDKYLMRGYAQAIVEQQQAFKYKNPNYKRKTR